MKAPETIWILRGTKAPWDQYDIPVYTKLPDWHDDEPNLHEYRRADIVDAEIKRLRDGYAEAIEDIEAWAAYASGYFQYKHDLPGCLAAHRAELAERDAEIAGLRDGLVRIIDAWDGDGESMHDDSAVIARAALAGDARIVEDYIDIVFDGPPGPVAGRFVEVEDSARRSIRFGEWTKRDDGFWVLRVANEQASAHRSAQIRAACQTALRALDTYEAMYRHHMTVQLYSARAGLRDALGRGGS